MIKLNIILFCCFMICGCQMRNVDAEWVDEWIYDGSLHQIMLQADRIVVRDGGMDCCKPVDNDTVLFEVNDTEDIQIFIENLNIKNYQLSGECECCGWPGIDFYKGKKRLALTALKHGSAIWWKALPSQASLAKSSQEWIKKWLIEHGISQKK